MEYVNIKELYIGSAIAYYYPVDGTFNNTTVKSIYFDDNSKNYKIELDDGAYGYCHLTAKGIRAIPLTVDILVKCGFVKVEATAFTGGDYYKYDIYRFSVNGNIQYFEWNGWTDGVNLISDGRKVLTVKYLHQLQNIYRILCGEELSVEL